MEKTDCSTGDKESKAARVKAEHVREPGLTLQLPAQQCITLGVLLPVGGKAQKFCGAAKRTPALDGTETTACRHSTLCPGISGK